MFKNIITPSLPRERFLRPLYFYVSLYRNEVYTVVIITKNKIIKRIVIITFILRLYGVILR